MPSSGFHAYQVYTKYTDIHQAKHSCTSKHLYIFFCFMYMNVLTVCLYLHCMGAWKPERATELLELLSQTVVNCHLHTRNWMNPDPLYEHQALRTDEPVWYFSQRINFENFNPKYNWSFRRDYFICGLLLCVDYCVCGIMMLHGGTHRAEAGSWISE